MLAFTALLFTTSIVATVSAIGVQFMDCPGNYGSQGVTRTCCTSDQLPKGCECYDISSDSDYTNTFFHKPQCPADIKVNFNLYTRDNRAAAQIINAASANITSSRYNGAKKTSIIAHGFSSYGNAPWCIAMMNALLDEEDMNVVIVDWQAGAMAPNYLQATANTRIVGSLVARLIQDMHTFAQADLGNFHLIGHSLGAHALGHAGQEVFRLTNEKVGRITGLDPAGSNFEDFSNFVRIDSTDAQFVDIIHTNAKSILNAGLGISIAVGHVDFYPNGGIYQPGCTSSTMIDVEIERSVCSHSRSEDYFTNSIQRCRYIPSDGNTSCPMGYHVSRSCRGAYSLTTTGAAPFC